MKLLRKIDQKLLLVTQFGINTGLMSLTNSSFWNHWTALIGVGRQ